MPIYCDESGGVGRGVMTLAALSIEATLADDILARFRLVTGLSGELKGSRIDLAERALVFELIANHDFHAVVSIALSAVKAGPGADRGDHDIAVYAALMNDSVSAVLPTTGGCANIIMDDGRYHDAVLALIRKDVAALAGPCGSSSMALSDRVAGLQLADVIANSFFNRALVSDRQTRMAAIVAPFLESGQIIMQILPGNAHNQDQ